MNLKKRLFMLILVLIYTQILFSSNDEVEKEIPSRLLENSIEKITDTNIENEKIETSGPKQLTDLGKSLIGNHIYSFLNGKDRAYLRLLSQFFQANFDDLYFNPYKILYPSLNIIERQLNDKFIDDTSMAYLLEKEVLPHYSICTDDQFTKGFKLKKNWWSASNLNLQTYGFQNFKLDISVGNGVVEISQSDLLDEVTDLKVGDCINITKDLILPQIIIDNYTKDQLVEGYKYLFVKKVETNDKGFKRFIVGEIQGLLTEETEPKRGDYWISSDIFKDIKKVKTIFKYLQIVKTSDGIGITSCDRIRVVSCGPHYSNIRIKFIEKKDLNLLIVKFCPQENKAMVLFENKEVAVLENPKRLKFIMNPHEYNFYLKFL